MAKNHITDAAIAELSLVFAKKDGQEFEPRNANALVLAVKAAEKGPSFLSRLVDNLKASLTLTPSPAEKGYLVDAGVPDNIDNDGDGDEDYEQIVGLLGESYYNLQSAIGISDSAARSVAIVTVIDNLLEKLDAMRAGEDNDAVKAGARHSTADKERIDKIGSHAAEIAKLHGELTGGSDKTDGDADKENATEEASDKAAVVDPVAPVVADKATPVEPITVTVAADTSQAQDAIAALTAKVDALAEITAKAQPAVAELGSLDTAPIVAAIGEVLKAQIADLSASFTAKLDAQKSALEARIATVETATTEKAQATQSKLEASVAAVKAARTPSAPIVTKSYQGDDGDGNPVYATHPLFRGDAAPPPKIHPMMDPTGQDGAIQTILRAGRQRLAQS